MFAHTSSVSIRWFSVWVGVLAVVAAVGSVDASAVLGGRAISVRSAPWAVSLRDDLGPGDTFDCTGVILDSLDVLTAAHCLSNPSGLSVRLSQITVRAGVSNFRHARASDRSQLRSVASVRFIPGYAWSEDVSVRQVGADIAVVHLTRPLDLDGADARAVALPTTGARRPSGVGFVLAGFGEEHASQQSSGALELMRSVVFRARSCSSARTLCGASPTSSSCPGDSGSGLIRLGPVPTLVGVLVTGTCTPAGPSGYVDIASPAILHFIEDGGRSAAPVQPPATRWVPAGWLSQRWFDLDGAPLPLLVSLPRTWITGRLGDGVQNVWNPRTKAETNVVALGTYTSRAEFFKTILKTGTAKYRRQDPGVVVRSRLVELPAGPALEVVTYFATKSNARELFYSIENYNLFHDGTGYDVEYQGAPSQDGIDIPVWRASARTIHFIVIRRPATTQEITPTFGTPTWTPLPHWAPWAPRGGSTEAVASGIGQHLAAQYRLNVAGAPLLAITGRSVTPTGSSWASFALIAVQPSSPAARLTVDSAAATWMFRLCGSGAQCAIGPGPATIQRGRLVRREALELALYTFEYAPAVGAVIIELPPPPATGPSRVLLYYRRSQLQPELHRQLGTTLSLTLPPLPTQPDPSEAHSIDARTLPEAYTFTLFTVSDAKRALVLTPTSS